MSHPESSKRPENASAPRAVKGQDSVSHEIEREGAEVTRPLLSVRNLRCSFTQPEATLLNNLSFDLQKGEILGLCGESGCGKSLTALSILNILPEDAFHSGEIILNQKRLDELSEEEWCSVRGRLISILFQDAQQALNPLMRVGKQAEETLKIHQPHLSGKERRERVIKAFSQVELSQPLQVYRSFPHELSGGMRQRIELAMGILNHPELLIADEPTTALDLGVQDKLLQLLEKMNQAEKLSILLISHDLRVVRRVCHRVLILYGGEIIEEGSVQSVLGQPAHPYTQGLIKAMPSNRLDYQESRDEDGQTKSDQQAKFYSLPGHVPSAARIQQHHWGQEPYCLFQHRCPFAHPDCAHHQPDLVTVGENHRVRCFYPLEYEASCSEGDPSKEKPEEKDRL